MVKNKINLKEINELIPHRVPFLYIDELVNIEKLKKATGVKIFTTRDSFFKGHFPGHPVVPGVILIEMMAQTAAALIAFSLREETFDKIVYLMNIEKAKFRKPVFPNEKFDELQEDQQADEKLLSSLVGKNGLSRIMTYETDYKPNEIRYDYEYKPEIKELFSFLNLCAFTCYPLNSCANSSKQLFENITQLSKNTNFFVLERSKDELFANNSALLEHISDCPEFI